MSAELLETSCRRAYGWTLRDALPDCPPIYTGSYEVGRKQWEKDNEVVQMTCFLVSSKGRK